MQNDICVCGKNDFTIEPCKILCNSCGRLWTLAHSRWYFDLATEPDLALENRDLENQDPYLQVLELQKRIRELDAKLQLKSNQPIEGVHPTKLGKD
jgi:hypothetical protein